MARGGKNYKKGTDDRADAVVIARAGEFLLRNENNEGEEQGGGEAGAGRSNGVDNEVEGVGVALAKEKGKE